MILPVISLSLSNAFVLPSSNVLAHSCLNSTACVVGAACFLPHPTNRSEHAKNRIVYLIFAIIMMIWSVMPTKHQRNLHSADDDQNHSQDNQPKRESLQLGSRLGGLISQDDKQARKLNGKLDLTLWRFPANLWPKLLHLIKNGVGFCI